MTASSFTYESWDVPSILASRSDPGWELVGLRPSARSTCPSQRPASATDDCVHLKPYAWPRAFEQSVVLYHGRLRMCFSEDTVDGVGQVILEWRHRPALRYRFVSEEDVARSLLFDSKANKVVRLEPLDSGSGVPQPQHVAPIDANAFIPDATYYCEGPVPRQELGDAHLSIDHLLYHLLNFTDLPLPEAIEEVNEQYSGRLTLEGSGWRVTIERPSAAEANFDELKRLGGYSFTHVAELRRIDGQAFALQDAEKIEDTLFHLLGFIRGALVGVTLPVAYTQSDEPVWVAWRMSLAAPWTNRLNWSEPTLLHEVSALFEGWLRKSEDPFWHDVLRRAVRHCLEANTPDPVDTAIVVSHSALELLAWAVLVVEERWLDPKDGRLASAGNIRLLLRWAGIDASIDPRLEALEALAKRENCVDGPDALVFVRNQIVHPPRKLMQGERSRPGSEEMIDAWRLAMEYAELAILRILGHKGHYGSRFHTEGRWAGQIERVPWATA